jgi:hypothetical protein
MARAGLRGGERGGAAAGDGGAARGMVMPPRAEDVERMRTDPRAGDAVVLRSGEQVLVNWVRRDISPDPGQPLLNISVLAQGGYLDPRHRLLLLKDWQAQEWWEQVCATGEADHE